MNPTSTSKEKVDDKKKEAAKWTLEQEELLAEWAEKAACYRWLHNKSEKQYRCRNYAFTIPVIILSTLTGTANFAMDSFVPVEQKKMAMGIVGGVNIFAGILSTLQNFLRYAELMEGHRSSGVSWSKFGRNIQVELALDEKRRKPAGDFLKICRAEFDRLIEQAPGIDDKIIKLFDYHFKDNDIIRPEVCNGIKKCKIYKPSQEEKLTNILTNVGDKLISRKDHLKTAKSWRKLNIKQDNVGTEPPKKGVLVKPKPIRPSRDMNKSTKSDKQESTKSDKQESPKCICEAKKDEIVLTIEPESEPEPEVEAEPEPEAEAEDTDSVDGFLDGITPDQNP
jgi:hypothetical protein